MAEKTKFSKHNTDDTAQPLNLFFFIKLLGRWKWILIILPVVLAIAAYLLLRQPATYWVETVIEKAPSKSGNYVLNIDSASDFLLVDTLSKTAVQDEQALLLNYLASSPFKRDIIIKFDLLPKLLPGMYSRQAQDKSTDRTGRSSLMMNLGIKEIDSYLKVTGMGGGLIKIEYKDQDQDFSVRLLNHIIDLSNDFLSKNASASLLAEKIIKDKIENYKNEYLAEEKELSKSSLDKNALEDVVSFNKDMYVHYKYMLENLKFSNRISQESRIRVWNPPMAVNKIANTSPINILVFTYLLSLATLIIVVFLFEGYRMFIRSSS